MANAPYPIKHRDEFNLTERVFYIADTDAGKPVSSLNVGDLCWAVDTSVLYVATSDTTMVAISREDAGNFNDGITLYNGAIPAIIDATSISSSVTMTIPSVRTGLVVLAGLDGTADEAGLIAAVNATAQSAAIGSTALAFGTSAGLYRISYYLRCTTASGTATIDARFTATDDVGATTNTTATISLASTANYVQGSFVMYLTSGNITYATNAVGTIGSGRYQLRARCEYLG